MASVCEHPDSRFADALQRSILGIPQTLKLGDELRVMFRGLATPCAKTGRTSDFFRRYAARNEPLGKFLYRRLRAQAVECRERLV